MHQRQWLFVLSMFSWITLGLSAQSAPGEIPTVSAGETVKVPAHRSKWDYPKEVVVPAGCQLYTVVKGDCLWNLGQRFLGSPFSWPQIWEQNKWIADPHWIYPGDPLVIPLDKKVVAGAGSVPSTPTEVAEIKPERLRFGRKPVAEEYSYTFQDYLQLSYLAPKGAEAAMKEANALTITQRRARERSILADQELVYLSAGEDRGVKVGDKMTVVKVRARNLRHPNTPPKDESTMGDVLEQVAVLTVSSVNPKGAMAVIDRSVDVVEIGDYVVPYVEPVPIAAKQRVDIQGEVKLQEPIATVCYARDERSNLGMGHMVLLDKGSAQGFQVGDILLCARNQSWPVGENAAPRNKAEERLLDGKQESTVFTRTDTQGRVDTLAHEKTNFYIGQMMVVQTGENTCTCRILRSVEEVMVGDVVTK